MNKKQCFQSMWIPITTRKPPQDKTLYLGWNAKLKTPILASGIELNKVPKKKPKERILYNSYVHITKWMNVYGEGQ